MVVTVTLEKQSLDETFDSIHQVLRRERNRTETEYEAFEAFASRIAELQPSNAPSTANPAHEVFNAAGSAGVLESRPLSAPSTTDHLATIKDAYEETVMSVPFYETEYGDTYQESVYEEFGQEVAIALTQGHQFNRTIKQILLTKVEEAQAERKVLIDTCDREHESITQAASVLTPIHNQLRSYDSIPLDKQGFGALDAYRTRLQTMNDKCEQVAATRQATINHHRTEYNLSVGAPDICAYLYKTFETDYPVLFLCSELAQEIENYRCKVEHAMSTCP